MFPSWISYTNSTYIKDLILDRDALWAAGGGVTKFDLYKGTQIAYRKEHGLASNYVLKMLRQDESLWIATANGISHHDIKTNTWRNFFKSAGLPDDAITALTADSTQKVIWFGSWEGYLFNFDNLKGRWNFLEGKLRVADVMISGLAMNPADGALLVGTWGKGVYLYNPKSRKFSLKGLVNQASLKFISAILWENNALWIGTVNEGLWAGALSEESLYLQKIGKFPDTMITSIKGSSDGERLFITTWGNGLAIFSKKTGQWKAIDKKQGLSTDLLNISAHDRENIYLGSEGEGVSRLNLTTGKIQQFKALNEIANNKVSAVAPDPQSNRLWIGTEGNGAACLDLLTEKWTALNTANHMLHSDVVNCIAVDSLVNVAWIGTDDGMARYEPISRKIDHYGFEQGLSNVMVYAAEFDHSRRLWAAFYIGNPTIFDPEENRWKVMEEAPSVICYGLSPDLKNKSMWMATSQGMIHYSIETRTFKTYWEDTEFRSVLFDEEKAEIWAGSWEKGLIHMDLKRGQHQKIKDFEGLSVLDIKKDPWKNKLWFATNSGVFCRDRKDQNFRHFDVAGGLATNYVLDIGITKDSIWFGTWGGGLSRLSP